MDQIRPPLNEFLLNAATEIGQPVTPGVTSLLLRMALSPLRAVHATALLLEP